MRSVYIHIPFCKSICSYCDFPKVLHNDSWADIYLQALENEIKEVYENDEVSSLYIGGGTPSSLSTLNLKKLFEILKVFKICDNFEFTFEVNVDDITEELCDILKENKVNRVSVGVESFNKCNLKFLNRKHTKKEIYKNIKLLKLNNFDNINIDLIYALPIETYTTFKSDLNNILKLDVPHISAYSLIIENHTVLKNNNIKNIDEETDYKMYKHICKKLKNKGYTHYEVSNYSKPGYESIHNLTYWNNKEYYGFGLGAMGYINNVRYENTRSLNKYINNNYRLDECIVSKKEEMENELIMGLRKLKGIDIFEFYQKYEINIQDAFDIKSALKEKLIVVKDRYLMIPEDKIYIMNEILNTIIK